MNTINYPKIGISKNQKVFVYFYVNQKRYRLYNGKRINSNLNPNSYPVDQRINRANLLAAEIYTYITTGGKLKEFRSSNVLIKNLTDKEILNKSINHKLNQSHTKEYKQELIYSYKKLIGNMKSTSLNLNDIVQTLNHYKNNSSYNSMRKNLNVIFNLAVEFGLKENPIKKIKRLKVKATLNKPIKDVSLLLNEILKYNKQLYLCCLMTYGCLLRPHREIRELTWSDFSDDLKYIHLSGNRNKSGRNRIVPVPYLC